MFGGLYRVIRPVTIQGVPYRAGESVRLSAALAREVDESALEPVSTLKVDLERAQTETLTPSADVAPEE